MPIATPLITEEVTFKLASLLSAEALETAAAVKPAAATKTALDSAKDFLNMVVLYSR